MGEHVLVVPFSRIYDIPAALARQLDQQDHDAVALMEALSQPGPAEVSLDVIPLPAPQSVSLNVSSTCNLGCSYCYASRGGFDGAQASVMSWDTAKAAIDRLIAGSDARGPVTIGFLGGEPFVNRRLIHRSVAHAVRAGRAHRRDVRFSVTTNGTLLRAADLELLREHGFAVTVSIDGGRDLQNARRPVVRGAQGSSYDLLRERVGPLLSQPGSCKIAARVTVMPDDLDLSRRFFDIIQLGFDEVGLSPLRGGGTARGFDDERWPRYLEELTELAEGELRRALAGQSIRLSNFAVALKQLHRGAASPYACGAGGGYFSVAADGNWYACHRAIGNADYRMGDNAGLDLERRAQFLSSRHVHAQTDCRQCWARYLCSGGCHQEAAARSVGGCDFIRSWLMFCLRAYCELSAARPEYFAMPQAPTLPPVSSSSQVIQ